MIEQSHGLSTVESLEPNTKAFIKAEVYEEFKAARAINAYGDELNAVLAPYIKAVEKLVFCHHWFVKGLTNAQRDVKLSKFCGSVICTDFSSFEAHHYGVFNQLFVDFVEMLCPAIPKLFRQVVMAENNSKFHGASFKVNQRLMSGAPWTSLQNTFLNFCVMQYLRRNDPRHDYFDDKLLVEGDDGISEEFEFDEHEIENLGLLLKIERHADTTHASFCGRVVVDGCCLVNPRRVFGKLQVMWRRYYRFPMSIKLAIYKAKLLSYSDQYAGCPLVSEFCNAMLDSSLLTRVDERVAVKFMDSYERERFELVERRFVETTVKTRVIFSELFGIGIEEQLSFEAVDHCRNSFVRLPFCWPDDWVSAYFQYGSNWDYASW